MRKMILGLLLLVGCSGEKPQGVHIGNAMKYSSPFGYTVVVYDTLAKTESPDLSTVKFDSHLLLRSDEHEVSEAIIQVRPPASRTDRRSLLAMALAEHPERRAEDFSDVALKHANGIAFDPNRESYGDMRNGDIVFLPSAVDNVTGRQSEVPRRAHFYIATMHGKVISLDVTAFSQGFGYQTIGPIPYTFDGGTAVSR